MSDRPHIGPQPGPQTAFLSCSADIAIYGGAAGGGKSYGLLLDASRNVKVPGYEAILFRRTFPELSAGGGLIDKSQELFYGRGSYAATAHRWTFGTGGGGSSHIAFSHLEGDNDHLRHQGNQYAWIGFDELTHYPEKHFWYLLSRNRTTCGVRPVVRATCNPDPDSWVKNLIAWWIGEDGYPIPERSGVVRYMRRQSDGTIEWFDTPVDGSLSITFISARLEDNPALTSADPGYSTKLDMLHPVEREQLKGGNWLVRHVRGDLFPAHAWRYVDAAPSGLHWVWAWDRASSTAVTADYTAGVRMARSQDGRYYIGAHQHFRADPLTVQTRIKGCADSDGRSCSVWLFRDPASAGAYEAQATIAHLAGHDVHTYSTVSTGGKVAFATPFSSQVLAGNVSLVRGSWNAPYVAELEGFPGVTRNDHDDSVDASSLAFHAITNSIVPPAVLRSSAQENIWA